MIRKPAFVKLLVANNILSEDASLQSLQQCKEDAFALLRQLVGNKTAEPSTRSSS